jgi:methyltransferase
MVMGLRAYLAFLALLALERGVELLVSRRHARALLARGAVEAGLGHYRPMVLFHAAFLAACAAEALLFPAPPPAAAWVALLGALLAQGLRWWAVAALGERWSTRILVLPGAAPVTGGPYRFLRHPNYLAVALEVACLPLAYGSWRSALLFTLGNAWLLAVRIRAPLLGGRRPAPPGAHPRRGAGPRRRVGARLPGPAAAHPGRRP